MMESWTKRPKIAARLCWSGQTGGVDVQMVVTCWVEGS